MLVVGGGGCLVVAFVMVSPPAGWTNPMGVQITMHFWVRAGPKNVLRPAWVMFAKFKEVGEWGGPWSSNHSFITQFVGTARRLCGTKSSSLPLHIGRMLDIFWDDCGVGKRMTSFTHLAQIPLHAEGRNASMGK